MSIQKVHNIIDERLQKTTRSITKSALTGTKKTREVMTDGLVMTPAKFEKSCTQYF